MCCIVVFNFFFCLSMDCLCLTQINNNNIYIYIYSITYHSPTINTSETLASILIPPFPLTPILYIYIYICIHMHKSIHYHLHCLRLIRRSIPLLIDITIASSYIIPLFDYCNSLLFNLREYKLFKLQRLQNAVVSCVYLLPRRSPDSITPLLKQLHWQSPIA